jgi:DNA modification methylase
MEIRKIPIEKLNPAAYNPRKDLQPGDPEYEKLKRSIQEFGYVEPIVWNKRTGNIVGGHQRYKVLLDMGMSEVDCVVVDLDETKEKALNLALNKIQGDWDYLKLKDILQELDTGEFDIEITGFDMGEIEDLMTQFHVPEEIVEDEVPEPPEEPITKLGDLWILGRHRLLCGDATRPEDVARLMNGNTADLVVTDPPYNVDYGSKAESINKYGYAFSNRHIANDYMSEHQFTDFLASAFKNMADNLKSGGAFYIWHASTTLYEFETALRLNNLKSRQQLIWNKNSFVIGRQDYQWKHEPCLYGWKDGAAHYFIDDRTQATVIEDKGLDFKKMKKEELVALLKEIFSDKVSTTVINEDKPMRSAEHPTMKPLKLLGRLIKNSSRPGELVLDTFGGSGSTMMTCEQLNRICYMMELDPIYCDVIIKRWENLTGQKAVLAE